MTKVRLSYAYTSPNFYPEFYLWHQEVLSFLLTRGLDAENGNVSIQVAPEGSVEGAQEYRLQAIINANPGQTFDVVTPHNLPDGDWYVLFEKLDEDDEPTGPAERYELDKGSVINLSA